MKKVIVLILILYARKWFIWNVRVEPGFEWLKFDSFSAKSVTQGHDTTIEYYWLADQSKKRDVKLLPHFLRCATHDYSFDLLTN